MSCSFRKRLAIVAEQFSVGRAPCGFLGLRARRFRADVLSWFSEWALNLVTTIAILPIFMRGKGKLPFLYTGSFMGVPFLLLLASARGVAGGDDTLHQPKRNALHGLQLSQAYKQSMARRLYHVTPTADRDATKKHLSQILSVTEKTIRNWLSRIDKDAKEAAKKQAMDLWLACWTQQDIGDELNVTKQTVSEWMDDLSDFGKVSESGQIVASHNETDADGNALFQKPICNVWKQQEKSEGLEHFGNTESRRLDSLPFLYNDRPKLCHHV